MVTRIDRLPRSIGDLQDIVRAVKAKGATLKRQIFFTSRKEKAIVTAPNSFSRP
jgi:DNA invertase Pin-like site-specific DNA recombinase